MANCVHNIHDPNHTIVVDPSTFQPYCTNCTKPLIRANNRGSYIPDWSGGDPFTLLPDEIVTESVDTTDAYDRAMKGI